MIEVKELKRSFGPIIAVDGISFSVEKGQVLGFLGPNGAGKSTAMKMLACFLEPDSGTASVCGHDIIKEPIEVRPVPGMPVIRDLVVDMDQFFVHYRAVKPYLIVIDPEPEVEYLQSPKEREKLDGLYECILCGCCSTTCPSFWWNPAKFRGPAALLQAYRFLADSRDHVGFLPGWRWLK